MHKSSHQIFAFTVRIAIVAVALLSFSACGQKGKLYLPDEQQAAHQQTHSESNS